MQYATNNRVRIHYKVEGDGPPVVSQHGFTRSIDGWYRNGYVDALKGSYQLILVNARGHGRRQLGEAQTTNTPVSQRAFTP
jgi:pimeloyl-ACP methyl ester carboxylesterase